MRVPVAHPRPDGEIERALAVLAHPDDVDFGAAGTIAGWTRAGIEMTYCIITDGQAGGFDPGRDRAEMPAVRRREQTAAAGKLGVTDVRFLGYEDGSLEPTLGLVRDVVRVVRQVRPQRLLCPSPERDWRRLAASHPDHLAAGEAAVRAFYPAAQNPFAFPELADEGLAAWTVGELWMFAHHDVNHVVDITDRMDAKEAALRCHESQLPDPGRMLAAVRGWLGQNAAKAGLPAGRLAEDFTVIRNG